MQDLGDAGRSAAAIDADDINLGSMEVVGDARRRITGKTNVLLIKGCLGDDGHFSIDIAQDLDRQQQLPMLAEGLEEDDINPGIDQGGQLFREGAAGFGLRNLPKWINANAERTDGSGDIDVVAAAFGNRQPRQFDAAPIECLNFTRAPGVGQLVAVGAKSIGLDQIGASGDISFVDGEHNFRRIDIHGIKAGIGARMRFLVQHGAHGAIGKDRRRLFEAFAKCQLAHARILAAFESAQVYQITGAHCIARASLAGLTAANRLVYHSRRCVYRRCSRWRLDHLARSGVGQSADLAYCGARLAFPGVRSGAVRCSSSVARSITCRYGCRSPWQSCWHPR